MPTPTFPTTPTFPGICRIDGTISGPRPFPSPAAAASVSGMSPQDRFVEVLRRTIPLLPGEVQQEFAALLSPSNLILIAATLAAWAGSHYLGVGFVVDGLLLLGGALFLGYQVITAAVDFCNAVYLTASATTSAELDRAAQLFANFVAVVGVAAFSALVLKGAKRAAPAGRAAIAGMAAKAYGGFTPSHYRVFQWVAKVENRIIAVRNTNPLSTPWIEKGFPAKPLDIKAHTSKTTGIVTSANATETQAARAAGYYVVDADGIPRNAAGVELKLSTRPDWPVEAGQIIDARQLKPLVGDYDLLAVIDPGATGRNIVLAADRGQTLSNWTNPETNRIAAALNRWMDQARVMHGAHDSFAEAATAGPSTVFFPDGSVLQLSTNEAIAMFYRQIGRASIIKP